MVPDESNVHLAPERDPAKGGLKLGKRIAMGGMAEVYLGLHNAPGGFEKLVVVKRLLPHLVDDGQFVQMFLDEARLASQLRHPGIVNIYDLHRDAESFFVVMEYLRGEDLRQLKKYQRQANTTIPTRLVLYIVARIADALSYAHNARDAGGKPLGLVHRDVAPSNIVVTYDGTVKLIDFGVAKAWGHVSYTQPGVIKGKYAYASPEQIRGEPLDGRSDVFALGVVLWELLAGRSLFRGNSPAETLQAVLEGPVPPPSEFNAKVTPVLDALVLKVLARDREKRTPSAARLRDEMEGALRGLAVTVSRQDLSRFMHSAFAEQIQARTHLEKEAVNRARGIQAGAGDTSSKVRLPDALDSRATGTGFSRGAAAGTLTPTRHRTRSTSYKSIALVAVCVLLVGIASVGAFWLGRLLSTPTHGMSPSAQPQ